MSDLKVFSHREKSSLDVKELIKAGCFERPCFLETRVLDNDYGKQDLFFYDPPILIRGRNQEVEIKFLNDRAKELGSWFIPDFKSDVSDTTCLHYEKCGDYIQWLINKLADSPLAGFGLYGALSYDVMRFSHKLNYKNEEDDFVLYFPDFVFHIDASERQFSYEAILTDSVSDDLKNLPKQLLALAERNSKAATSNKNDQPLNLGAPRLCDSEQVMETLEKGMHAIDNGKVDQLTLSRIYEVDYKGSPFEIYQRYSERNPTTYNYFFDFNEFGLIGASIAPQLKYDGNKISTRAIGGTVARNSINEIAQVATISEFLASEKEKNELDMLIDLAVGDIAKISHCLPHVSEYRRLSYFSKVIHSYANVSAQVSQPINVMEAVGLSMPAGTVSGIPRGKAVALIQKLETSPRGFYGGAVGRILFNREFDFALSLRGVHFTEDTLKFRVGSTLVAGSDIYSEFHEAELKAKGFFDALLDESTDRTVAMDIKLLGKTLGPIEIHDSEDHIGHFYKLALGICDHSLIPRLKIVTSLSETDMDSLLDSDIPTIFVGRAAVKLLEGKYASAIEKKLVSAHPVWKIDNQAYPIGGFFQSWSYASRKVHEISPLGSVLSGNKKQNYDFIFKVKSNKVVCLFDLLSVGNSLTNGGHQLLEAVLKLALPESVLTSKLESLNA